MFLFSIYTKKGKSSCFTVVVCTHYKNSLSCSYSDFSALLRNDYSKIPLYLLLSLSLVFSRLYITLPATAMILNSKSTRIKMYTWTRKQQQTFRWLQRHHSLDGAANVFPIITLVCLFICLFLRLWLCGVICVLLLFYC